MWQEILTAFSLFLIIEGMVPFVGPSFYRKAVVKIAQMDDNGLRLTGLTVASIGIVILYIVR
ncbi:MAG: DUF2065 family protein [Woeseiaceae bacterium]|jgi:uncharacterized protein YjeT (DUF2065 family)|nr:DUF2065 family protein [Woeseiaceae bacterium]|tara:strand:- start:374 stop:559 length:186 start_codon:yes stop_codon:yes gene_type:complete